MTPRDSARTALPADLAAAVELGGEMGRRFAEFDWAAHPLGAPAQWQSGVCAAVAVVLTSRFPIVLWLDPDELFLVYNDAYLQILGEKHPAALGRPGRDVWWDIWEPISPMLSSVIATGEATWSFDLMLPMVAEGHPRERYFTFTYSPLLGADGRVYGIFCPSFETTERVQSERRLHVLNAVAGATMATRSIADAATAAVAACDEQPGDLPFVAAYLGGDGADITVAAATAAVLPMLPRTLAELAENPGLGSRQDIRIIDAPKAFPGIEDALADDCPHQALMLPLSADGASGALVIGVNPRIPLDAQYRGFCQLLADQLSAGIASAVSYAQQRRRADELAELDRAKTAFLTNVSHEFRTPLTLMTGPIDDALADAETDALLAQRLHTARRNAGRLLRLVDSLLDFSRIEAGRATPHSVCVDIGALTAHIASSFAELCVRAGLELDVDSQPALVDIDPAMWETILLNLLSNAVKYTLAGRISVSVRSDSQHCRITVQDTGIGIAAEDLSRIGERFFRAANARGRSVEGTGIGLALVRGLVELQHGSLQVASEVDRGTAVTIELSVSADGTPVDHPLTGLPDNPYVIEASQWLATVSARPDDQSVADRALVLIADDNADMRAYLDSVLSPHWRTVLVADGEAALRRTRELRPDAIVTDVMMPILDGFDFVAAVRADPGLAGTPVVMLSARAGTEAVSDGYAGGADDYLPKPFRSQELIERIAARLASADRHNAERLRREAELQRAAGLAGLEAALQAAESASAIVNAILDSAVGSGGATVIVLGVLDAEHGTVRFEYAGPVPAELRDRYHVATLETPLVPVEVIKSGTPMVVTDTSKLDQQFQNVVQETADHVRACVSQPLRGHDGAVIGSLGLLWPAVREFDSGELETFAAVAEMTQSALQRLQATQREHRIAVEFQESLLHLDCGSTAAVVAAEYRPAGEAMRVGGDWYLVVPLDRPRRVGISVGDVVGNGLPAAIAMSQLRSAVAATALTGAGPDAVLDVLDAYGATVPDARCATVSYAVIDSDAANISYSCAGHPYPLLIAPDGARFLESGRRCPVAVGCDDAAEPAGQCEVPPGSVVLLYTDGLIEWPGQTLDQGFHRLLETAGGCADLPVGDLCAHILERMAPSDGYDDDVVILALRPVHRTARSFATAIPAGFDELAGERHRLRDWMAVAGVDPGRQADILMAIGEAVTNAIEHGNGCDPQRTVTTEAFLRGGTLAATVSDSGQWAKDSSASRRATVRGRGLTLMNTLADDVETVRTAQGTRVTLRFDRVVGSSHEEVNA